MNSTNFQQAFDALNPAQREAVEAIEGPVLIVAGPGTGKTQTLALRLANILKQTQARPQNLLALTFTEAAAIELKKRLAEIIGPAAYGITATTFHSFCAGLAATFPAEFAQSRERVNLDALGQYKLIQEILKNGEYQQLRPLRAPELYLRDIGSRLQTLKREGITPARLSELVAAEQAALPTGDARRNKKTGAVLGRVATEEKRVAKQVELAQLYAEYQQLLGERSLADYDDLILSVVEKLTPTCHSEENVGRLEESLNNQNDFLLAHLQENYLYVTVDEYQDTNGAQNALLKAWASYDTQPNLCAVGDDDQSIYRFQGASLANILEYTEHYEAVKIVTLTTNYRSTQTILDASRSLIEQNKERLTEKIPNLSKVLTAAQSLKSAMKPVIREYASEEDEAAGLATEIAELLTQAPLTERGSPACHPEALEGGKAGGVDNPTQPPLEKRRSQKVAPTDIAVLYRERWQGDLLAEYLARAGVPVHRTDGRNALADPRVRQVVNLLAAVNRPNDAAALLLVLFADYTAVPTSDVYRLARALDRQTDCLDFLLDAKKLAKFEIEVQQGGSATLKKLAVQCDNPAALATVARTLMGLQQRKADHSLAEVTSAALADSGLSAAVAQGAEYSSAEALTAFLRFVRGYGEQHTSAPASTTLPLLLADLQLMGEQGIALPIGTHEAAAVTLGTVHGSKGREWQHVYVVGCTDDRWGGKAKPDKLKLPDLVPTATPDDTIEDERRLMYVALTRAKQHLTLSSARTYAFRPATPSRFLAELDSTLVEHSEATVDPATKLALTLPQPAAQVLDESGREFLASLVTGYRLSATGLNNYLTCPRLFLWRNLLRLPEAADSHLREIFAFGTVTHRALEEFFRVWRDTGVKPAKELALDALTTACQRESLPTARREKIRLDASADLSAYLDYYWDGLEKPLYVEHSFGQHDVRLPASETDPSNAIPLTGKVDRIDQLDEKTVRLVDYKTQTAKSEAALRGQTADSDGATYRQLLFYQLLAELDPRFIYRATELTVAFTRPDPRGEFREVSLTPTSTEADTLKTEIRQAYSAIQALEFDCTEDTAVCRKCALRKVCGR